ncbi:hypothetical protein ES319_D13G217900v1 [Gossypium barbadense]|uniref:Formin-like protein n=1 Tax=Gossypium barbadense TaxID=3634 RepID=A0A5J5NPH4_GOSBA|nr:hypothetical protein ES319_D13G217900v1 [Gossypium barbadense]KAB1996234.1 hypothetical protein ES319_D13G217900v1 [Gossypium barbadense]
MGLFRKLFYKKPPDGLLEICERVHVFDCCFTIDAWEEENYKVHVNGIVNNLHGHFPDASFLVFNFREGESKSYMAELLSEYDMTIMDYPCQYEGCPLIAMEVLHHFLRSCESWLSLDQNNLLLMHCERGGWPVLAFMLAALLIYRKQYSGEQKTLDMIYKQAPSERLQLLSSLNPVPSQLRYLQYVSRRNVAAAWPPLDRALTLDCVILRQIPNADGEGGCRPVFRIYGQDPFLVADKVPKLLYSTPKRSKYVRYYKQKECALVKIDINCHVQGDIVVECVNLSEKEREKMIFRVVFNSAFIRSNILMLNRDEIDVLWDAKDQFPKEFRAEILFSEMDAAASITSMDNFCFEEKEGLPIEAFAKVQEMFSNVDWLDPRSDAAYNMLQQMGASSQEKSDSERNSSVDSPRFGRLSPRKLSDEKKLSSLPGSPRSPTTMGLKTLVSAPSEKSSLDSEAHKEAKPQDSQIASSSQPDAPQSAEIAKDQPSEVSTSMSSPASAAASTVTAPLALAGKEDQVIPTKSPLSKTSPAKEDPEVRVISPATSPPPTLPVKENQTINDITTEASASLEESLAQRATTPAARTPSPASPLSKTEVGKDGPPAVPPPSPVIAESPVAAPSPPQVSAFKEDVASTAPPPSHPSPPPHSKQEASPAASSLVPPTPPPPPPTPTDVSSANQAAPPLSPSPSPSTGSSSAPPPPPPPTTTGSSSAPPPPPPPLTTGSSSAPPPPPAPFGKKTGGGPSAPAPPPLLSSANSKNRLLSRSSNSKNDKKLKPLHWLKLSRAVQGSLWAEAQKTGEASKTPEIDISELENLFSAAAPNTDRGNKQGSRTAKGPKTEIVQLIDHRRAYNCEIMLSKVKVPLPELMSSVLALEESALDVDQVDNLIKFCPTKEEMELLKGYTGDKDKFGKCEQFFLELMKVPRVESKLRVFSFKIQFRSQVSDLRHSLNIVNSTAEEIRNSVKLKRIMQTILSLGNALNQGTARGSAIGFKLDSLLKLTDTRARNNRMTLMHYLCKVLADKLPVVLDFSKDVSSLEPAAKIQLKFLAEEMQAISKGLEKVVQELSSSENDGPVSDSFREKLKEFLCFAEAEVRSLASLYSGVGRNVDALILYFGEDPARCSFEQVTSTLLNFVRMFNKAHDENCKQLEQEMKKSAENDKSKMQDESKNILQTSIKSNNVK